MYTCICMYIYIYTYVAALHPAPLTGVFQCLYETRIQTKYKYVSIWLITRKVSSLYDYFPPPFVVGFHIQPCLRTSERTSPVYLYHAPIIPLVSLIESPFFPSLKIHGTSHSYLIFIPIIFHIYLSFSLYYK